MSQLFASGGQSIGVSASSISPSNEYSGLSSFRMDWSDLLAAQGTLQESSPTPQFKSINFLVLSFLYSSILTSIQNSLWLCLIKFIWDPIVNVAQLCPILCNPMDYTVHGILQTRILKWVAVPFSRESSQPKDQTQVSHIAGRFFTSWATRESQINS